MSCYPPPFGTVDSRMLIASDMGDHFEQSSLMEFHASNAEWIGKEDPFDPVPWVMPLEQPAFGPPGTYIAESELHASHVVPNNGPSRDLRGYLALQDAVEDALSYSSPVSDRGSDTWSPTHHIISGSQSPPPTNAGQQSKGEAIRRAPVKQSPSSEQSPPSSSPVKTERKTSTSRKSSLASTSTTTSKSSAATTGSDTSAEMTRKKAAHNAIEKRYRTNMNAKFLALGNAIPKSCARGHSFSQLACSRGMRRSSTTGQDGNGGVAQQQNKSEILTNALTYIRELQEHNQHLQSELTALKENLLSGGGGMMWRRAM